MTLSASSNPPVPPARSGPYRWSVVRALAVMLWFPVFFLYQTRSPVPRFSELRRDSGVVRESSVSTPGHGSVRSSAVILEIFTGERLMKVRAPYGPATWKRPAQPGDSVVVWTVASGNARRAWQMDLNGSPVFSYAQARRAAEAQKGASRTVGWVLLGALVFFALLAILLLPSAPHPPPPPDP